MHLLKTSLQQITVDGAGDGGADVRWMALDVARTDVPTSSTVSTAQYCHGSCPSVCLSVCPLVMCTDIIHVTLYDHRWWSQVGAARTTWPRPAHCPGVIQPAYVDLDVSSMLFQVHVVSGGSLAAVDVTITEFFSAQRRFSYAGSRRWWRQQILSERQTTTSALHKVV